MKPSVGFGLGVAAIALWPSCGGKSVVEEGGAGEGDSGPTSGTSGVGASSYGGDNFPGGGVGASVATGGDAGTNPMGGVGNVPTGGFSGVGPFGGAAGIGFGGAPVSGFGGGPIAGAGGRMGGRMGMGGFGGRVGGMGGRFGGRGGFGGVAGVGGFGGASGAAGAGVAGKGTSGAGGLGPSPLDGFVFQTPCGRGMISGGLCTVTPTCDSPEASLPGMHSTDVTVVMPGTPGVRYVAELHVQGLVESKTYTGGTDQDGYSSVFPADGFYSGGSPTATTATTYLIRVSSPARDYFLNSISPPTMSSVAPPVAVDYRANILFDGGTTIRLVSADSDCKILPNCGSPGGPSTCSPVSVPNLDPRFGVPQPYQGQFVGLLVERTTAP